VIRRLAQTVQQEGSSKGTVQNALEIWLSAHLLVVIDIIKPAECSSALNVLRLRPDVQQQLTLHTLLFYYAELQLLPVPRLIV
jgi:hypothetical protein